MKKRIKFFFLPFIIFILFTSLLFPVFSETVDEADINDEYKADAVYLYSYNANRVLYSKCDKEYLAPASTAKMMVGLLVCERYADRLEEKVPLTAEMLANIEGTAMGLREGMTLTVKDLLYGTVCGTNNDAATALAIACSGDIPSFVAEMNSFAKLLDMRDTLYVNPTGLDADNAKTTLNDTVKLAAKAAANPLYMTVSSTVSYNVNESLKIYNRNALISQFSAQGYINKNAKGLIAGSTDEGGYVVATYAEKNGTSFLCVVMGANADAENIHSYHTANSLLDNAFKSYEWMTVGKAGDSVYKLDVDLAISNDSAAKVYCVLEKDAMFFLPKNTNKSDITYKIYLHSEDTSAPLSKEDALGGIDFYYKGNFIGRQKLVANSDVEANSILLFLHNMKSFLLSSTFWLTVIISIPLIFLYIHHEKKNFRHKRFPGTRYHKP